MQIRDYKIQNEQFGEYNWEVRQSALHLGRRFGVQRNYREARRTKQMFMTESYADHVRIIYSNRA